MQWIICIAAAIIRAFGEGSDQNMTEIAQKAGMSRQTLYHHLRMAIESLHWVYLNKQGLSRLLRQMEQYRHQWLTAKANDRGVESVSPLHDWG
jgi:AcrR family transcriptional regulator